MEFSRSAILISMLSDLHVLLIVNLLQDGATPLHAIVRRWPRTCVMLLLDAGADVNVTTKNGDTPLALALKNQHPGVDKDIMGSLLAAGAFLPCDPLKRSTSIGGIGRQVLQA